MKNNLHTTKQRLNSNELRMILKHEAEQKCQLDPTRFSGTAKKTAFIYDDVSMNFTPESFAHIQSNPNWRARLEKPHSTLGNGILEMQSCNSSDARLMDIFCHPNAAKNADLHDFLGISTWETPVFGWKASLPNEHRDHPTECDMKIGNTIFEAKLTEKDFTQKRSEIVEGYPGFFEIFDAKSLPRKGDDYLHYQLIRNITVAHMNGFRFMLLIDERRADLRKAFNSVLGFIRDKDLKNRCRVVTWQEIDF